MNRVIIAGSREFSDYSFLKEKLDYYLQNLRNIEIVSGGCKGTDKLGERYAQERNLPLRIFEADWDKNGKAAGPIRNREMAEYGTHLIGFYKEGSRGTKNMIEEAQKKGLKIKIVNIL